MAARRVVVAVQPRLLADTLVRALRGHDVDVAIYLDPPSSPAGRFDLAVVMDSLPPGIDADVVIRLPDNPTADGSITTGDGTEPVPLHNLAALLEALDRFLV